MTLRNWQGPGGTTLSPTSGDFLTAGNWAGGIIPGTADVANFVNSGTYTVSFSGTASVGSLSGGDPFSTFDLAGGDLALSGLGVSNWTGAFNVSGGTLAMASNGLSVSGTFDQTGGTILLGTGVRLGNSSGSMILGGTQIGGALFVGSQVTLDAATLDFGAIQGNFITLASDESFAGNLISITGLTLDGHALTLSGISPESSVAFTGPGTVDVTGTLGGSVALSGTGGTLVDAGLITDDRGLNFANASLLIGTGAMYDMVSDSGVSVTTAVNLGLLEKTVATVSKTTQFAPALINTGTLLVAAGTIQLSGVGDQLGGTLDGAGMLKVTGTATLEPGVSIAAATTLAIAGSTALLVLGGSMGIADVGLGSTATLSLAGNTLTLQNEGSLDGTVLAAGSLVVDGSYGVHGLIATGGSLAIENAGTITDGGGAQLGIGTADHVGLQIDAGASYVIAAAGTMFTATTGGTSPHAQLLNAGLFTDIAGGTYKVVPSFTNEAGGTLLAGAGTLSLAEGLVNNSTGTVTSVLTVAGGVQGAGTLVIGAGATVTVSGTVSAGSTFDFAGAGGELVIGTPSLFAGTVLNFAAGDTIDLAGVKANQNSLAAGGLTLSNLFNGIITPVATIALASGPGAVFVTGDGGTGTDILAASPGRVFTDLTVAAVPINWTGGSGDFGNAGLWSGGAPSAATDASLNVAGATATVDSADTIDALSSANITLDVTSGALIDNNGGHWFGNVVLGGGTFESVTGFTFGQGGGAITSVGTAGVLQSDSGTVTVTGTLTVAGTLAGGGAVGVSFGTLALVAGSAIDAGTLFAGNLATIDPYASETISSAVVLTAGTLTVAGSVTLAGQAVLDGVMSDAGTIVIAPSGSADVSVLTLNGTADVLSVLGVAAQTTGDVTSSTVVGATATIDIAAGATWDIGGDDNIKLHAGAGVLANTGLLEKSAGSGTSIIQAHLVSTGTLLVNTGTVTISAGGIELGGTVAGGGELATVGTPASLATTLDSGLILTVATFNAGNPLLLGDQTYSGDYISTGTATLQGHALTLGGQVEWSGAITGPGTVDITGSADTSQLSLTGNGVTLAVAGSMTASSNINLGVAGSDAATLAIAAGGSFALTTDAAIFAAGTSGIVNAGVFAKVGGFATSDIGAAFHNTGTVQVAHATLEFAAAVSNDAVIDVNGGLVLNAALGADMGQAGTINLTPSGTLTVGGGGSVAASQSVSFDPGGVLELANGVGFAGTLENFGPGDSIELIGTTATAVGTIGGAIVLSNGTTTLETIAAPGIANPANLLLNTDGQGNSWLVELACFASGTRILTASGEVDVEALRVGDLVPALVSGGLRRIRWIGSRRVDCRRHNRPQEVWPVRVREGAFAPGVPTRDLMLSLDHAVAVDGVLIPVRYLMNGTSIAQEEVAEITYWHIELEAHDVVLAEGLPAETFLDTGNRSAFAGGPAQELHPGFAWRAWDDRSCLPLALGGSVVARIRDALQARANTMPRASQQPTSTATTAPASSRRNRNVQSPGAP